MNPPVFTILNASATVKALLGTNPLKVFPWSEAPQNTTPPYATYGVYNGNPQNTMDQVPQIDNLGTQVDIWASSVASCLQCALAVRNALEPHAHMTSTESYERDPETNLFRTRMDFDFFTAR